LAERDQRRLARAVCREAGKLLRAEDAADRRDVDDRAASASDHSLRRPANGEKCAANIHGEDAVPITLAHLLDALAHIGAGVIDQNVAAPEPRLRFSKQALDG